MLGNVLQQLYNLVDTWVVGHYIGDRALAAVGSSYTLMTFITSIIIGLCLGTGAFISMAWGAKEEGKIRNGIFLSFVLIGIITLLLMAGLYLCVNPLHTPAAGSGGDSGRYEGISGVCICRIFFDFFV